MWICQEVSEMYLCGILLVKIQARGDYSVVIILLISREMSSSCGGPRMEWFFSLRAAYWILLLNGVA